MNISDAQISQCVPDQLHKDIHRISNNDRLHVASIRKFVSDEKYLKRHVMLLGFLLFVKVVTGFLKNDRVQAQICYVNFLH